MRFEVHCKVQICSLLLILASNILLNAQFSAGVRTLKKDQSGRFVLMHQVEKSESWYAISKMYAVKVEELLDLNTELSSNVLHTGQILKIPLNKELLRADSVAGALPLQYIAESADGIFHLSTRVCGYTVRKFKSMNKLNSEKLQKGQVLRMGYIQLFTPEVINSNDRVVSEVEIGSNGADSLVFHKFKNGIALSEAKALGSGRLFVLHNEAAIDSYIEIINPVLDRKVLAKVIGRIPPVYEKNVQVIVSQEVARQLASVDHRFFVYLRYN